MNTTSNALTTTAAALPALKEPTVQDLHLAGMLGYKRPADIRKLIKRHLPTLEVMGLVRHRGASIVSGKGRVGGSLRHGGAMITAIPRVRRMLSSGRSAPRNGRRRGKRPW